MSKARFFVITSLDSFIKQVHVLLAIAYIGCWLLVLLTKESSWLRPMPLPSQSCSNSIRGASSRQYG